MGNENNSNCTGCYYSSGPEEYTCCITCIYWKSVQLKKRIIQSQPERFVGEDKQLRVNESVCVAHIGVSKNKLEETHICIKTMREMGENETCDNYNPKEIL